MTPSAEGLRSRAPWWVFRSPRRPFRIALLGLSLGLVAVLVGASMQDPSAPEGVRATTGIVYREVGDRQARLDLYQPEEPPPPGGRPVVIAIHGGGWRGGSKDGYGRMAARLAQQGYVVVSVSYLLSKPDAPSWPDNFEDVREAVRWVRRHAREYGIDPDRVVAMGASAGGHLAALLGCYPDGPVARDGLPAENPKASPGSVSARVQAVIDFYGPTDLVALQSSRRAGGPIDLFLGGSSEAVPGRYEAASPVRHVSSDDPPMLLFHGDQDQTVPIEQAHRLVSELKRTGVRHSLIVVKGAGHGFGLNAGARDLLPEILAFLDQTWDDTR